MVWVRYTSTAASTQTPSPQTTFKVYFTLMPFISHFSFSHLLQNIRL